MPFQKQVNIYQAPALEGDFASANPRAAMLAGEGTLIAGAAGVTVGSFAWANGSGVVSNTWAAGRLGFCHRENQAINTVFLAESGNLMPVGTEVVLHVAGDFWDKFVGGATIGQSVYGKYADGSAVSAVAVTTVTSTVTTATDTSLNVTAVTGAPLAIGQPVTGTGIAAGSYITAQVSGIPGGIGMYTLSAATTASASVTGTVTTTYLTPFKVATTAAAGELAKISTWG